MNLKKLLSAVLAALMIMSLAACGGQPGGEASKAPADPSEPADVGDVANDPKVTLVYAEVNPLDTIVGQTASEFKRLVEDPDNKKLYEALKSKWKHFENIIKEKEN